MKAYLERIDPIAGMARFYVVMVQPDLFGTWMVTREWGRIGQAGTVREGSFDDGELAAEAAAAIIANKCRRGYQVMPPLANAAALVRSGAQP